MTSPVDTPPAALWRLQLLGGFELSDGQQRIPRVSSRAALLLLARLALQPRVAHAREVLVDLLWPDADPEAGRHRLRQTLSTLRKLLEPPERAGFEAFEADRLWIRLRPGVLSCDVQDFEAAVAAGQPALARSLYRGELLPGLYDDWVEDERRRLADLAEDLPSAGAPPATTATAATPPPAAPTPPAPGPAPNTDRASPWPHYMTRWLGDASTVQRLRTELRASRLVTLLGPGGIGKTRLAVATAASLSTSSIPETQDPPERFTLGCFVPLAGCRDAQAMLDQLELSLRLGALRGGTLEAAIDALAGRRALLVLDNLEQLGGGAADIVTTLLQRLPELHVLITSRRPLGVAGEHLFAVPSLNLPEPHSPLAQAAANPAVALFVDRARAARADFHLHAGNLAGVVEVVRRLEGVPLAIELAAARVRSIAPARMAQLLHDASSQGDGTLALLARAGPEGGADRRHGSMQAAIAWSWALLTDPQRDQLQALTIPVSPFSAAVVPGLLGCDEADAIAALDELAQQSWLRADPDPDGEPRFALSEPMREFVAAGLPAERSATLRAQHRAGWLARTAAVPPDAPLRAWQNEWPDLVRTLQAAVDDGAPAQAIELALGLRWVIEHLRLPLAALRALSTALDTCNDATLVAEAHAMLAPIEAISGRIPQGLAHVDSALAGAPPDRPDIRAEALLNETRIRWTIAQADPRLGAALDEAATLIDTVQGPRQRWLKARWCGVSGLVTASRAAMQNRPADVAHAVRLHREAQALWLADGNAHMAARVAFDLGNAAYYGRRFEEAVERMRGVLAHARSQGLRGRQSQSCQVIGDSLSHLRRWDEALPALQECILVAWDAHAPLDMAFGFWCLARPLLRLGHAEDAVRLTGFIEAFWTQRCGALNPSLQRQLVGARRLAARCLKPVQIEMLLDEGRVMTADVAVASVRGFQGVAKAQGAQAHRGCTRAYLAL